MICLSVAALASTAFLLKGESNMATKAKLATHAEIVQQAVTAGKESTKLGVLIRARVAGLNAAATEVELKAIRTLCRKEGKEGAEAKPVKELNDSYSKAYSAITSVTSRMKTEAAAAAAATPEGKAAAAAIEAAAKVKAEVDGRKLFSRASLTEVLERFQPHVMADESYTLRDRAHFKNLFDHVTKSK